MKKVLVLMLMVCFMAVMAAPIVATGSDTININTASVDELTQLQKVGPKTAENIVAYRDANGPFKTVDDLKNVKGVGDKILELNKDRMTVGKQ
ncbi:MAG: helix-hairpin-helix domain-containing protein [Desulfobacteraceae bacterium]|nr:helix-hairpin-helix domain-containing protein [Desulfobacteraceae bacterium]MBC2752830.1 helix-hairpin-helix domain-containing protein [Desulfobacteraceae bacterium]